MKVKKKQILWIALCAATLLAACAQQPEEGDEQEEPVAAPASLTRAAAQIEPRSGSQVTGTATFTVMDGQVTAVVEIQNAPPGTHAFHIHETGDCSAPDGTSAGGHWNPTGEDHGEWGVVPFHLGDVGNVTIGEDGSGSLTLTTDLWSLGTGEANDILGLAVILHAGADDFTSQPTGAAGGRTGCGVIE